MYWELWDAASGNLLKTFDSEKEALATIREYVEMHGRVAASEFGLIRESRRGNGKLVGYGEALINRAFRRVPKAGKGTGRNQRADDSAVRPDVIGSARQIIEKRGGGVEPAGA